MHTFKKLFLSLSIATLAMCACTFSACKDEAEETVFEPVGTYTFYSYSDGTNTYEIGKTVTIDDEEKELMAQSYILTLHDDGYAEFFTFGSEEILNGIWQEKETLQAITLTIDDEMRLFTYENDFLIWEEEQITWIFQKTQAFIDEPPFAGKYSFFSLTVNGEEYLSGENFQNLALSEENFQYYVLPNGFLNVTYQGETYTALWGKTNEKPYFLLQNGIGATRHLVQFDELAGILQVTIIQAQQPTQYWEFHLSN